MNFSRNRPSLLQKLSFFSLFSFSLLFLIIFRYTKLQLFHPIIEGRAFPYLLLVINYCTEKPWNRVRPELFNVRFLKMHCDPKTNNISCRESVNYLQLIVDNYDKPVAKKFIFIHAHNLSWHYKTDIHKVIPKLLDSKELYEMDYGSINHFLYQYRPYWVTSKKLNRAFVKMYHDTPMMKYHSNEKWRYLWFTCCGSFFVNSRLFKLRPKSFYQTLIHRLRYYSIEDPVTFAGYPCSRLIEYTWHVLFTDDPIMYDSNYTLRSTGEVWSEAPPLLWGNKTLLNELPLSQIIKHSKQIY